jgi:uncharacterized protein (DUF4415 family)
MSAKLTNITSNLSKIDSHLITAEEYDEIPELTDAFFEQADQYRGGELIRRGRPKLEQPKLAFTVRYDAEVIEAFKATGRGWQTRMNDALKQWLREHSAA